MSGFDADIDDVLSRRYDNGADYWATEDRKLYVGHPFSTIGALIVLHELGVPSRHEAVSGALSLLLDAVRDDGRIRLGPSSPLHPCYTAEAARALCRFGMEQDGRVQRSIGYLIGDAHSTGGWRCNFTRFGKGPETACANPGATLFVLDVLRHDSAYLANHEVTDAAVESLLDHWDVKTPVGPCHYGIGSRFMKVEYPFLRYNLFYYVYVLSHYTKAQSDARFRQALSALQDKLGPNGDVIVEHPHRSLNRLSFCTRGKPSASATERYREIERNLSE